MKFLSSSSPFPIHTQTLKLLKTRVWIPRKYSPNDDDDVRHPLFAWANNTMGKCCEIPYYLDGFGIQVPNN